MSSKVPKFGEGQCICSSDEVTVLCLSREYSAWPPCKVVTPAHALDAD